MPAAIDCFMKQTYQNRELVIVIDDDIIDAKSLYFIESELIKIKVLGVRYKIGEKRNICCRESAGEIICHWDDDDWSAPDRIEDQVNRLQETGKPITGYGTLYFWDQIEKKAKIYRQCTGGYVCGTTLCYLKSYWQNHQFRDDKGKEDNTFVYSDIMNVADSNDPSHMVARIHSDQTAIKDSITECIDSNKLPLRFWENERLIQ